MLRLHCSDLWVHLPKLAKASKNKQAAVAYVSDDSTIQFGAGDVLVVDASDAIVTAGQTSAKVLKKAFDRGAKIYSCPNLHSKVYVFDGTAVVGSSNASASSAHRLLEAAVITDNPAITSAARKLISELQSKSSRLWEKDMLRLMKIPVEPRFPVGVGRKSAPKVNPQPGVTWLVATHDLDASRFAGEERQAERGHTVAVKRLSKPSNKIAWIRFGKAQNISQRAREGDWVIQMRRTKRDGRVSEVSMRAPIRFIQHESECVRIYLENFRNSDLEGLRWGLFQRLAKSAGIPRNRLRRRSIGVLTEAQADALDSLWRTQPKLK